MGFAGRARRAPRPADTATNSAFKSSVDLKNGGHYKGRDT